MTILTVMQAVTPVIGLTVPDSVISSTEREHVELTALANEMAKRIALAHDWQLLSTVETITGDGSTEAHSLPSDYDRMPKRAQVWSSSLETPLSRISSIDRWLGLDVQSYDYVINAWIIYGGQIHIKPALANAVTAKYFYQSNLIITPNGGGSNQTSFTNDGDTFRLDEDLLKLGMIWQWKANKGRPYAEDMANYEDRKERLIERDKGSRIHRMGRVRLPRGVDVAYPQTISES